MLMVTVVMTIVMMMVMIVTMMSVRNVGYLLRDSNSG